jgi:hypothetical protein
MEIETKRFNDKIINLKGYNKSEKKCGYLYKKIGPKFMSYFIIKHQKYIILEIDELGYTDFEDILQHIVCEDELNWSIVDRFFSSDTANYIYENYEDFLEKFFESDINTLFFI